MIEAAIGLGSNQGDKAGWLNSALAALEAWPGIRILAVSRFYRTAPVGFTAQDWFLNAAVKIETGLSARELMRACLSIEQGLGRVRGEKWGPRTIDLDLLFYGQEIIEEEGLSVPHPYLDQRRFVLLPLVDVAPDWVHPRLGISPAVMAARLVGQDQEVIPL